MTFQQWFSMPGDRNWEDCWDTAQAAKQPEIDDLRAERDKARAELKWRRDVWEIMRSCVGMGAPTD